MRILHLTPHMGGGVGTVIMDWMGKVGGTKSGHSVVCLDYANEKAKKASSDLGFSLGYDGIKEKGKPSLDLIIDQSDVVLVHYWDHPMLAELFSKPIPSCRMVFWCHKHITYPPEILLCSDRWLDTSLIQGNKYIWSTGNMKRFLAIKPKPHRGFNIGTVASKKLHEKTLSMFEEIRLAIPGSRFTIIGDLLILGSEKIIEPPWVDPDSKTTFTGKVDDVAPYLAEMDVFAYPLRSDHYGTCEIALGEAMCAEVVPVVMYNPAENQIVDYGKNGLSAKTETEFIDEVLFLYNHAKERRRMSKNARKDAKKLYSIDSMIASWNEEFESMMKNPKTRKEPI